MSLAELLPIVQSLPHADKIRLIQFLATELARDERVTVIEANKPYPVWSPYQAYDAAAVLMQALQTDEVKK